MKKQKNKKISGQFRQGDVLIMDPTVIFDTKQAKKVNNQKTRTVLEFGEVTGHAHALYDKTSSLYEWEGSRLLETKSNTATVKHEEHAPIKIGKTKKEIRRQTEYTPAEIRNIAD